MSFDWDTDYDDTEDCTICGGDGETYCLAGLECFNPGHVDDDCCPCFACGGTGRAQDQRIW